MMPVDSSVFQLTLLLSFLSQLYADRKLARVRGRICECDVGLEKGEEEGGEGRKEEAPRSCPSRTSSTLLSRLACTHMPVATVLMRPTSSGMLLDHLRAGEEEEKGDKRGGGQYQLIDLGCCP